ncbi:unnamed protein product [Acanthosepion pharaonis]|uniref:Uncharacterized protein n=1 Tax=Acanthosepion pharaonis TaxID=158019 RepID=A0A812DB97_ACAPH|nr:unnamed protein product [Sepia pharaonis]
MDRTVSRRSEPSSRTALMGEQPNPWNILQPQVAKSRHRGAKPSRRFATTDFFATLCPLCFKVHLLAAYLLPKLRYQFAEFLQDTSLKRLGILYLTTCVGTSNTRLRTYNTRDPSHITVPTNINVVPIDYALRLALGAGLTCADERCAGTLGLSARGHLTPLTLLMSAFALLIPPRPITRHLHRLTERSLPRDQRSNPGFDRFGDLSWRSGLFPSSRRTLAPAVCLPRLFRFRSPLLTESRLMSFPPGTEMFQFSGFASKPMYSVYLNTLRPTHSVRSVQPSGQLIKRIAPEISQAITSFAAPVSSPGIHPSSSTN